MFIDQPLSRQLDLIRTVLPEGRRIGVVFGPSSRELRASCATRRTERKLTVEGAEVAETSGVYGALQRSCPESDVLLALPDPVAINAGTVYGLLLTSYHAQVPVVGFSEGWVKAGALVSLFSTARQQGRQGAEIASRSLSGEGSVAVPQYPKYFTVRVNTASRARWACTSKTRRRLQRRSAAPSESSEPLRPRGNNAPAPQGKPVTHWGIRPRILFLALAPSVMILLALVSVFHVRKNHRRRCSLAQRGVLVARQLGPGTEFALFAGDHAALQRLTDAAVREADVASVVIADAQGQMLAHSESSTKPRDEAAISFTQPVLQTRLAPSDFPEQLHSPRRRRR